MNGNDGEKIAYSRDGWFVKSNGQESLITVRELACPCCGINEIDIDFIDALDLLIKKCGTKYKFTIESGCRCESHNAKIGGSKTSAHLPITLAADIKPVDIIGQEKIDRNFLIEFYKFIDNLKLFKGLGIYNDFVHVDIKDRGKKIYWVRKQNGGYLYFDDINACINRYKGIYEV